MFFGTHFKEILSVADTKISEKDVIYAKDLEEKLSRINHKK